MMTLSIPAKGKNRVVALVFFLAWLGANFSVLQWLGRSLLESSYVNWLLIGLGLGFLGFKLWQKRETFFGFENNIFEEVPFWKPAPFFLMLGGLGLSVFLRWTVDIDQLNALLFFISSYGLIGFFIRSDYWFKTLPIAALLSILLPFSAQFSSNLGLPAQVLTAHSIEQLLKAFNIAALSSYDIVVLEKGIAQVNLPCSGLKSIWTGSLFLLAATWLDRRILGWKWLGVAILNVFFLITANIIRVFFIVVVYYFLKQPQIADILHTPLGVIGFVISCGLTWLCLQKVPKANSVQFFHKPIQNPPRASKIPLSLILSFFIAIATFSQFHPLLPNQANLSRIQLPESLSTQVISLSPAEQKFFEKYTTVLPQKHRFKFQNLSGSFILIANASWENYHPPELCLIGSGYRVDTMEKVQFSPQINARWINLEQGQLSAIYWFQSPKTTTDDFFTRFWQDVTHHQKNWALISILFDQKQDSKNPELQQIIQELYQSIQQGLT